MVLTANREPAMPGCGEFEDDRSPPPLRWCRELDQGSHLRRVDTTDAFIVCSMPTLLC